MNTFSLPSVIATNKVAEENEQAFIFPPGLLGQIAEYIYASSPKPVRSMALTAAIALMAAICGRSYNVKGTGLNLYLLMLAKTGRGKEAMKEGIDLLMEAIAKDVPAAKEEFIGPGEIRSGQGLHKHLAKKSKSFVSILGEFGERLHQLSDKKATSADQSVRRYLLDLFHKSGKGRTLDGMAYSRAEDNVPTVSSPAFSILAESRPKNVYEEFNIDDIDSGLLPRFIIFEHDGECQLLKEGFYKEKPSKELVKVLTDLCVNSMRRNQHSEIINVEIDSEAEASLKEVEKICVSKVNEDEATAEIWNRFHVKTMRLAALAAIGIHPYAPCIARQCVEWSAKLNWIGTEKLIRKFANGEIGKPCDENRQQSLIERYIAEYYQKDFDEVKGYGVKKEMHERRLIPRRYFNRKIAGVAAFRDDRLGATKALDRTLGILISVGYIQKVSDAKLKEQYSINTSEQIYTVIDTVFLSKWLPDVKGMLRLVDG